MSSAPEVASPPNATPIPPEVAELKIEEIVTEEILAGIFKNLNRPELQLVDYEAKLATIAGDNYMSIMYALQLNMKNSKSGELETVLIMLKVLPRNEFRVKMITEGNIFVRDINFYSTIAPAMVQFQKEKGLSDEEIFSPWPKCYACKTDGKGDFLAMEDLKTEGFRMANRQLGLDLEHCKLVMQTLARFHAVSYAMFQGDFDAIMEKYPWLDEVMFNEDKTPPAFKEMGKHTFAQLAAVVKSAGEDKGASLVEKMYGPDYFPTLYKLVGAKVKWAVIGHGDCWTNNIMFAYDEENKPVDIKLVDYQISRVTSRWIDLHYFLYTSPQKQILNENEEELAQLYFEEFTKYVSKLGVDIDAHGLTKDNFLVEMKTFRYYGCVTGLFLAMVTSADTSDVPEMESIKEEDLTEMDDSTNPFVKMMKGKAIEKIVNIASVHLPKCDQMKEHL